MSAPRVLSVTTLKVCRRTFSRVTTVCIVSAEYGEPKRIIEERVTLETVERRPDPLCCPVIAEASRKWHSATAYEVVSKSRIAAGLHGRARFKTAAEAARYAKLWGDDVTVEPLDG